MISGCVWQLDHTTYPDFMWIKEALSDGTLVYDDNRWKISTYEGVIVAFDGDYLIRDVEGEVYFCKKNVIEKPYEIVEK